MEQEKTNTELMADALEGALKRPELVTLHREGQDYVQKDSLVRLMFDGTGLGLSLYKDAIGYLHNSRSVHSLGKEIEFEPPIVDFGNIGIYYQRIVTPTVDRLRETFEELYEVQQIVTPTPYRDRLQEYLNFSPILARIGEEYDLPREYKTAQLIKGLLLEMLADTEWVYDDFANVLNRDLKMNLDNRERLDALFQNANLDDSIYESTAIRNATEDVYGVYMDIGKDNYPDEFMQHILDVADDNNMVLDGEYFVERMPEFPENIKEIGEEILSDESRLIFSIYGEQVIPLEYIQAALRENYDLSLRPHQIKLHLIDRESPWREPLIMNGFPLFTSDLLKRNYEDYDPGDVYRFPAIRKHRMRAAEGDRFTSVEFAPGFPVEADGIVFDNANNSLVYLSMTGDRTAIRGNWAELMKDKYCSHAATSFKVGNARNHEIRRTELPSGLWQIVMVINEAVPEHQNPSIPFAYIPVFEDYTDRMPDLFIDVLGMLLTTPLLPEWGPALWVAGRITGLIDYASDPNKQIGGTVWKIRNMAENWNQMISSKIAAGDIFFNEPLLT